MNPTLSSRVTQGPHAPLAGPPEIAFPKRRSTIRFAPLPDPRDQLSSPSEVDLPTSTVELSSSSTFSPQQPADPAEPSTKPGFCSPAVVVVGQSDLSPSLLASSSTQSLPPQTSTSSAKSLSHRLLKGWKLRHSTSHDRLPHQSSYDADTGSVSYESAGLPLAAAGRRSSTGQIFWSLPSNADGKRSIYVSSSSKRYPPVAQRGGRQRTFGAGGKTSNGIDEPVFVEWDFAGKRTGGKHFAQVGRRREDMVGDKEDLDEGSGLAWVRKRQQERERRRQMQGVSDSAAKDSARQETRADIEVETVRGDLGVSTMVVASDSIQAALLGKSPWTGDEHELPGSVSPLSGSTTGSTTGSNTDEEDNSDGEANVVRKCRCLTMLKVESEEDANLDLDELAVEDRLPDNVRPTTQGAANEIYHGCVLFSCPSLVYMCLLVDCLLIFDITHAGANRQ
jgi:hypothetical protein